MENKKDWVVIDTVHERYSFETTVRIYRQYTLQELKKEVLYDNDNIEKTTFGRYIVDRSCNNELDTKYSFPELEGQPLEDIHLDSICFIALEDFLKDDYVSYIWGSTNKKFGLIDIKEER